MRKIILLGIICLAALGAIVIPASACLLGGYTSYSWATSWMKRGETPGFGKGLLEEVPHLNSNCNTTWAFHNNWRWMLKDGCRGWFRGAEIEVSEGFKERVIEIASGDEDVQELLSSGYNVTAVKPMIKLVVQESGEVSMKATSAILILTKDKSSIAFVEVNVETEEVTKITIINVTVIDKSTSP